MSGCDHHLNAPSPHSGQLQMTETIVPFFYNINMWLTGFACETEHGEQIQMEQNTRNFWLRIDIICIFIQSKVKKIDIIKNLTAITNYTLLEVTY